MHTNAPHPKDTGTPCSASGVGGAEDEGGREGGREGGGKGGKGIKSVRATDWTQLGAI